MSKETGGQTFPRQQWEYDEQNNVLQYQEDGMTLRDYFAAKAPPVPEDFGWAPKETDTYQRLVRWSYFYADAMLASRNK